MQLITLSSAIAIRTSTGTKMVGVVEAKMYKLVDDTVKLHIYRYYDSTSKAMQPINPGIASEPEVSKITVRRSNIRSQQEVM